MAAVQSKEQHIDGLTKESLDGASDWLDGDREMLKSIINIRHNVRAIQIKSPIILQINYRNETYIK